MTFAIGALGRTGCPTYLSEHDVPPFLGLQPVPLFGAITALAGLTGTIAGGVAGDALRRRIPGSYFLVSGVGLCIGAPCALLFLAAPFPAAWLLIFLAEFFIFFNTGPSNTILANVTHPAIRATGFAANIFVIHVLGDAISPFLIGVIADRCALHVGGMVLSGLNLGFVVVSAFMFLGGILWLLGTRHLERDTLAAPNQLQ